MCDDLSDVTCCGVFDLVPAWLELVAAGVCVPGVRVRVSGHRVFLTLPAGLQVSLFHDTAGAWSVRVQTLSPVPELGAVGRPFTPLGVCAAGLAPACGPVGPAVELLRGLTSPASAVEFVRGGVVHPDLWDHWAESTGLVGAL